MNLMLIVGVAFFVGGILLLVSGQTWGVALVIIGGILARTGSKGFVTSQIKKAQAAAKPKK